MLRASDYLPPTRHDGAPQPNKCEWTAHESTSLSDADLGALAWVLADTIMAARFGPALPLLASWRSHTLAGTPIPDPERQAVAAFVEPVFGLRTQPKSDTHLYGHVGEWLWHLLTSQNQAVKLQPEPKGDVTDSGGDGFSIYEDASGGLHFRLWESKKYTGKGGVSGSINKANKQLAKNGQRYIAKIVGALAYESTEIISFMSGIPVSWVQGGNDVGAGVTIATDRPVPKQPFRNMSKKFPKLGQSGQLRGVITSIDRFKELARLVREYTWTAL